MIEVNYLPGRQTFIWPLSDVVFQKITSDNYFVRNLKHILLGIWDFMTGKLKFRLANSALGAIITHAIVNEEGSHVVAAESGDLLYWDLNTKQVTFKDKQEDIQQIFFYKNQTKCIVVSKKGKKGQLLSNNT